MGRVPFVKSLTFQIIMGEIDEDSLVKIAFDHLSRVGNLTELTSSKENVFVIPRENNSELFILNLKCVIFT